MDDEIVTLIVQEIGRKINASIERYSPLIVNQHREMFPNTENNHNNFFKNILLNKTATCQLKVPLPSEEIAGLNPQLPVNVIRGFL